MGAPEEKSTMDSLAAGGKVASMAAAVSPPAGFIETMGRFDANVKWACEHGKEFAQFEGRYVAIDEERVVDVGDSRAELRAKYADRRALLIRFVDPPGLDRMRRWAS